MTNFSPREIVSEVDGESTSSDAETIRFVRGFHDIFVSVGLVLLFSGLGVAAAATNSIVLVYVASALVAWVLAELLVRARRLVLPGIVLAVAFVYFAGFISAALFGAALFNMAGIFSGVDAISFSGAALLAGTAFYLRFRLPFSLGLVAAAATLLFISTTKYLAAGVFASDSTLLMLLSGLVIFSTAMWFDFSDRDRETLRADNAFWLHLLAAPILVHAILSNVPEDLAGGAAAGRPLVVIAIFSVLALIALFIDRRALLVAGLGYLGIAIATLLREATQETTLVSAATLLILGSGVVWLGVGWHTARNFLLHALPLPDSVRSRLPPSKKTK